MYEGMKLFWREGETYQVNILGNFKTSELFVVITHELTKVFVSLKTIYIEAFEMMITVGKT